MIILLPAYGRTYTSVESLLKDWQDGKDFRIAQGPYTSVRDRQRLIDAFDGIVFYFNNTTTNTNEAINEDGTHHSLGHVMSYNIRAGVSYKGEDNAQEH